MRISDTFAKRLLEVRGDMSQAEFAQRLGVSRGSIGLYEQGKRLPDIEVLRNIAEQFNVSCDWLVGLTDTKVIEPDIKAACEITGLTEDTVLTFFRAKITALDYSTSEYEKDRADNYLSISRLADALFGNEAEAFHLARAYNLYCYAIRKATGDHFRINVKDYIAKLDKIPDSIHYIDSRELPDYELFKLVNAFQEVIKFRGDTHANDNKEE